MTRIIKAGRRRVEYTLICARNRTKLLLQALPEDKIRLYAPAGYSLRAADAFVLENIDKIDEAHSRMREASKKCVNPLESIMLGGRRVPVTVTRAASCRITIRDDSVSILTPYNTSEEVRQQLKRALTQHALAKFRHYLDIWAPGIGKEYGRVTVREQKSRWGSCSSKQNLNFNWKLVMAPEKALEYVVIHELCHLIHFNHSAQFWSEVRSRMPDYEIWKKWLKDHSKEMIFD